MKKRKVFKETNEKIKKDKSIENMNVELGEDVSKYGEWVSSYFAWITPKEQKEKAEKMNEMTKNKQKK